MPTNTSLDKELKALRAEVEEMKQRHAENEERRQQWEAEREAERRRAKDTSPSPFKTALLYILLGLIGLYVLYVVVGLVFLALGAFFDIGHHCFYFIGEAPPLCT